MRARGFSVNATEKFSHDARYTVTDNWPRLVQPLVDFAKWAPEVLNDYIDKG